ncbi:MAG: hypothetical protein PVF22_06850 [Candidatus Aminicenantes bacterium]|jgi:hypothetical protein
MSKYKIKPAKPQGLKTYPLQSRDSKVSINHFANPLGFRGSIDEFITCLPDVLAARDLRSLLSLMGKARAKRKAILFGLGGHVIKVGLNPLIIDLMREGWISGLAFNGAGIIHDFEVAYSGHTSEDVGELIGDGRFGMSRETGKMLNEAISAGQDKCGLGEIVGEMISGSNFPYKDLSLLASAYELNIPVTVHVAIGTDTIHFHPKINGGALGKTSLRDFFLFCSLVERLNGGGVYVNVGSAVVLPEVFLKAVTFLRNKGISLDGFSTAVFDFLHHYRPDQNVVKRPLGKRGKGFYFIGPHEIMVPLLAAALKSAPGKS